MHARSSTHYHSSRCSLIPRACCLFVRVCVRAYVNVGLRDKGRHGSRAVLQLDNSTTTPESSTSPAIKSVHRSSSTASTRRRTRQGKTRRRKKNCSRHRLPRAHVCIIHTRVRKYVHPARALGGTRRREGAVTRGGLRGAASRTIFDSFALGKL